MKIIKFSGILFLLCLITTGALAYSQIIQQEETTAVSYPLIPWASNTPADKVTIENGTGATLNIIIKVNDDGTNDPAGIIVDNCGETKRIDAGSTAICVTSSIENPVTFGSDKNKPASGTYQIKQQLPVS